MVSRILALILLTKLFLYTGQAWALPQCIGTLSIQTWTNCQGSHTYSDSEDKYIGEFLNNKRHGQGAYYYSSGAKYVGDFKDGEPTAKAVTNTATKIYTLGISGMGNRMAKARILIQMKTSTQVFT